MRNDKKTSNRQSDKQTDRRSFYIGHFVKFFNHVSLARFVEAQFPLTQCSLYCVFFLPDLTLPPLLCHRPDYFSCSARVFTDIQQCKSTIGLPRKTIIYCDPSPHFVNPDISMDFCEIDVWLPLIKPNLVGSFNIFDGIFDGLRIVLIDDS